MKTAFCTCVTLGLSCIEAILENGYKLDLLITLHDHKSKAKSGRIYLDEIAARYNITLLKINHINDAEVAEALKQHEIDWLFIIGWSQIASSQLIDTPKFGVIGAHPTLLPQGRGRAAIPWAIIKGLKQTGVTFFKMDEGVDTGPILDQFIIPITPEETSNTLYEKVNAAHVKLVLQIFPKLLANEIQGIPQEESKATYWEGRTPADGELNKGMKVEDVERLVRATTQPYPGAYIRDNENKIIIWSGHIGEGDGYVIQFRDGSYVATDFEIIQLNKWN